MPTKEFRTKSGTLVATGFVRVVHGGRGDYIEFDAEHIVRENIHIPPDQAWRQSDKWKNTVFYDEWRTQDESNVKLYHQRKYVGYADYNPGMWYVAPGDLVWEGELEP